MDPLQVTADVTLPVRDASHDGDRLQLEGVATPDGIPVKLTDGAGREIGTARVVDGRIHATVTDPAVAQRLRLSCRNVSMGYRVVIEPEPAVPWRPSVGDLVESSDGRRGQVGTVVRDKGAPLPWVVRWPDGCETGYAAREIRPAPPPVCGCSPVGPRWPTR